MKTSFCFLLTVLKIACICKRYVIKSVKACFETPRRLLYILYASTISVLLDFYVNPMLFWLYNYCIKINLWHTGNLVVVVITFGWTAAVVLSQRLQWEQLAQVILSYPQQIVRGVCDNSTRSSSTRLPLPSGASGVPSLTVSSPHWRKLPPSWSCQAKRPKASQITIECRCLHLQSRFWQLVPKTATKQAMVRIFRQNLSLLQLPIQVTSYLRSMRPIFSCLI